MSNAITIAAVLIGLPLAAGAIALYAAVDFITCKHKH